MFVAITLAIGLVLGTLATAMAPSTLAPEVDTTTPEADINVAAPTETPTETPTVDAMTPAPTPAPTDDTTVATMSTRSTLAPEVGDP